MRFRDKSDSERASHFVYVLEKVRQRPWQSLDKKAWAVHGKSKLTEAEEGETGEE
jgi:hypothetical protein